MAQLGLRLLGGFLLRADARPRALPARKAQALLAYLALRAGGRTPRETLTGLFWAEAGERRRARACARHGAAAPRAGRQPARARHPGRHGDPEPRRARPRRHRVRAAGAAGDAGGAGVGGGALSRPAARRRAGGRAGLRGVARVRARAAGRAGPRRASPAVDRHVKGGRVEAATQAATRLLALDSVQEETHRTLMRLYARQGRRAAALRQYQTCVAVLQKELGVEPEPATRRLYLEILQRAAAPSGAPGRATPAAARTCRGTRRRRAARRSRSRAGPAAPAAPGDVARRGQRGPRHRRGRHRQEPAPRRAQRDGAGPRHAHAGQPRLRDRADPALPALGGCAALRPRAAGDRRRSSGRFIAARRAGPSLSRAGRRQRPAAHHPRGPSPALRDPRRRARRAARARHRCCWCSRTSTGPTR